VLAMTAVNGLLISCATPAASRPTAASSQPVLGSFQPSALGHIFFEYDRLSQSPETC
jgi:hypothetical protein